MSRPDLILMHPPSVFRFRELPLFFGPVSDVVPSTSVFEIYPIGFLTISEYLARTGFSCRIVNMALKMLQSRSFDPEAYLARLEPGIAFGIDLHWLPHADGSLSLAALAKKLHPRVPVILGGLSASYFHEEIMRDHPFVDFIVRGDAAEEPLRLLLSAIRDGAGFAEVPNLVWRDGDRVRVNDLSFRPPDMDYINFDYSHLLRTAIRYHDPSGYIPFKYWLSYPVTAAFCCRGCTHNCGTCGGSRSSFQKVCGRSGPTFRSPDLLVEDIRRISDYTGAPVIVLGDLLQAGDDYCDRFLSGMKKARIRNEICIEFFRPPSLEFLRKVADAIPAFNVEISPESHDIRVRKTFGKDYTNEELEGMIEHLLDVGCRRVDLFFMVGLPGQTAASVMETVAYCGDLLARYGWNGRILPLIAPLAPFIDPGSLIFEQPERYGYRFFHRTLAEHRRAMLMPSWKFTLNYETDWMSRDEIVRVTYRSALALLDLKEQYGVIGRKKAAAVRAHIARALALSEKIRDPENLDESLREEIRSLNTLDQICDKHELEWPVKGLKLNVMKLLKLLLLQPRNGSCRPPAALVPDRTRRRDRDPAYDGS